MSGILSLLDIGKKSLSAQNAAMNIAGNNIANVNTAGYSRQEAVFNTSASVENDSGYFGTGVELSSVKRITDNFLSNQITLENSNLGKLSQQKNALENIESVLSYSSDSGINSAVQDFFNSFQDLANDPSSSSARTMVVSKGNYLADTFNNTASEIKDLETNIDVTAASTAKEINSLTQRIAKLNGDISALESGSKNINANDLRDQRDELLKELSSKIDITYFENKDGQLSVIFGGGKSLVDGVNSWSIETVSDSSNENSLKVLYVSDGGKELDITNKISGGEIGGLLEIRNNTIKNYRSNIDKLALSISNEVNKIHQEGVGLDGSSGNIFFDLNTPSGYLTAGSKGNASITSVDIISSSSPLVYDNYQLIFTSSTSFDIYDSDSKQYVSTNNSYTSGNNIDFNGISVVIEDQGGTPVAGDNFVISTSKDAAADMHVTDTITGNTNKIAAGVSSSSGDNENALKIAELQFTGILNSGQSNFGEYYQNFLSQVGNDVQMVDEGYKSQQSFIDVLVSRKESISGVSLDEEMSNLIKYQYGYEASAKLISTVNDLLDTVINLVK
ncbi:MAG: flagellar hook-associated protein FlgK [Candidatus Schekmanbacteria bacterium]|nr:flagellar hook-associated protein FlgK [Candidatus Schekmanbacteria bacterium]